MKTLTAENDFGRIKQIIALADIMVDEEQSVVDVANNWAVFQRHLQVATSIALQGLKNPIIVLANADKYRFTASGGRIQFAVVNGYTHIDAIVLKDEADVRQWLSKHKPNFSILTLNILTNGGRKQHDHTLDNLPT